MCSANPVSSTFKMNSKYRTSCHLHSNHLIQAPSSRTWINGIGPLTGLSVSTLSPLQSILHPAFRLILLKCKSYHDVPLLETLHWLSACLNKIPNPFLGLHSLHGLIPALSLISFPTTAHLTHSTLATEAFILLLGHPKNSFASGSLHIPLVWMIYSQIPAWFILLNASMPMLKGHLSQKLPQRPYLKQHPSVTSCLLTLKHLSLIVWQVFCLPPAESKIHEISCFCSWLYP